MSPYPGQVTREQIIETAWELVEAEGGIENLPLSRLAKQLGIKAPSLYRHVNSKEALADGINDYTERLLFQVMRTASEAETGTSAERILAIAHAYRRFGHRYPVTYTMRFATLKPPRDPEQSSNISQLLALQSLVAQISGPADALTALRGLLAIMHGFVMLEINGQLQRGGNLDEAFEKAVKAYLRGWQC